MPKDGFCSITVKEEIYDKYQSVYNSKRADLAEHGITSFSGYITLLLREIIKEDAIFKKYDKVIETIAVRKKNIVLKDHRINRIVWVQREEDLFCQYCVSKSCSHIGFCFSLWQSYPTNEKGVVNPYWRV